MNGDAVDPDARGRLSTDELTDAISDSVRRSVLFHLRQHGMATLPELVDVLVEVGEASDRERLRASLRHVHLPKLAALGLVTHDADDGVVEATDALREVDNWLDLGVRRDLRVRAASSGTEDAAPIRVLLVDDEPGLPETIADHIEREDDDIEVTTAKSVPEASTALQQSSFDCIVSDYKMPAISGLDFLKAVRAQDDDIPFIVYTAKGSEQTAGEAIRTGVTDYVRKRPDAGQYGELADHIREAVGRD